MADLNYGEIYWGPFAHNGSKHMALLAYYTDTHVFLFPISSQQSTQDYWYRIDSRAVVELEETEANAIFGSGAKHSFIYWAIRTAWPILGKILPTCLAGIMQ